MIVAETPPHVNKKERLVDRKVPSKPNRKEPPLLPGIGKERPAETLMIPDCFESTEFATDNKSMIPGECLSFKPRKRRPEILDLDHIEGSLSNITIDDKVNTPPCVIPGNVNGRNGSVLMAPPPRHLNTNNKKNFTATTIRNSVGTTQKSLSLPHIADCTDCITYYRPNR